MTKPDSIRKFDLFYLGSIVLSLINFALNYGALTEQVRQETAAAGLEMGGGVLLVGIVFSTLISLLLWFLISKKRIEFVKWILILFLVWSFVSLPAALADGVQMGDIIGIVVLVVQIAAIWFLFREDAKAWFKREDEVDSKTFD